MHSTHHVYTVLLILILLIAFWLRLDDLDTMPPGMSTDESFNVVDSFILAQTGYLPLYEDLNRPEHLHRIILAAGSLFGSSVWAYRLVQVFAGVITVALADWATRQCLPDLPRSVRRIAGLAAAGSLAVALSHVVLSRSLYRGLWQPVWMLVFTGFLMRGLHAPPPEQPLVTPLPMQRERESTVEREPTKKSSFSLSLLKNLRELCVRCGKNRDFVIGGIALGLALHTYTAALVIPLALPVLALSLLIVRSWQWRHWLPGLIWLGVALAIVTAPITVMLVVDRDRVLTRAADVGSGLTRANAEERLERVWDQMTERGDINSQYNADYAPILPPIFDHAFMLGLLALLLRLRHPSSALLAILLLLGLLPVMLSGEIPHGLRIVGEFAVFPLIIGVGVGTVLGITSPPKSPSPRAERGAARHVLYAAVALALIGLTIHTARDTHARYRAWWDNNDHPWEVYGLELTHGDWFFRTDHRDLGEWLTAQHDPLLIPVSAIRPPTMRAWLQDRYRNVTASAAMPAVDTLRLIVPWALELGDLRWDTRQFALLHGDTITILPPLDPASYAALTAARDQAEDVYRNNGDLLLETTPIQPEAITFETQTQQSSSDPLAVFDDSVAITGWRGPDTLDTATESLTYTLELSPTKNGIPHYYSAFVHLHTQDYQRIAGADQPVFRWLYPPPLWDTDDVITIPFTLDAPAATIAKLPPGAYRLIVGFYRGDFPHLRVPVTHAAGNTPNDMATIGWIKVPQHDIPAPDDSAVTVDAILGDQQFALIGARADEIAPGTVNLTLTWQALADRPDLDATIFVHALDGAGNFVTQNDARPWNGQYPAFIWDAGEFVRTEHVLAIGDRPLDDVRLIAGMYIFTGPSDTQRLDVVQDGAPVPDQIVTLGNLSDLIAP